jgi:hypothetical protein
MEEIVIHLDNIGIRSLGLHHYWNRLALLLATARFGGEVLKPMWASEQITALIGVRLDRWTMH